MNLKSFYKYLACFAVGVMTGGFFSSDDGNSNSQTSSQDLTKLKTKDKLRIDNNWNPNSASHPTSKPGREQNDSMISVPVALLESMSLSKSTRSINQPILDDNDPVEAALGLTGAEKQRIQRDWQLACENVKAAEIKSLKSEDLEDSSVLLKLPDLSKERREIAAAFMQSLTENLGNERADAFFATKQVNNMFSADAGERAITVKVESVGPNEWSYNMTLQDSTGTSVWVGESIPLEIRHLGDAAGIFPTIEEVVKSAPEE